MAKKTSKTVTIPSEYPALLPGEQFIAGIPDNVTVPANYIVGKESPSEEENGEQFVVREAYWYDLTSNQVMVLDAVEVDSLGQRKLKWVPSPGTPKLVGDSEGQPLGVIISGADYANYTMEDLLKDAKAALG